MISRIKVQGTMTTVPEIECSHETIYLRQNIIRCVETTDEYGQVTPAYWEYDETEMNAAEYTNYVREQATTTNLDTMEALTQVYEDSIYQEDLNLSAMEAITTNYESLISLESRILTLEGGAT